jgi:DUF1707 SHOCT-like domain
MSWQNHGPDLVGPQDEDTAMLASDADRDAAAGVLNEAFADGRLTADEHGERVRAAYAGRTWQELAQLTADLPGPAHAADLPGPAHAADLPGPAHTTGRALVAGAPYGLDWCLLCALLMLCPPVGIALLLAARHRSAAGQPRAVTAGGGRPVFAASDAARAGDGWRAEDR